MSGTRTLGPRLRGDDGVLLFRRRLLRALGRPHRVDRRGVDRRDRHAASGSTAACGSIAATGSVSAFAFFARGALAGTAGLGGSDGLGDRLDRCDAGSDRRAASSRAAFSRAHRGHGCDRAPNGRDRGRSRARGRGRPPGVSSSLSISAWSASRVTVRSVTVAAPSRKSTTLSSYSGARSCAAAIALSWKYLTTCGCSLRVVLGRLLPDQAVHLGLGDNDVVRLADLRQQQPEADAALGDAAVLGAVVVGRGLLLGLDLPPDRVELGVDHRRRHGEVVARGERVEQLALHVGARHRAELGGDLILEDLAQRVDRIDAEALGEVVVERGRDRRLDCRDGDGEFGRLPGQIGDVVVGREGDLDRPVVAGDRADQLVLEAGDELARAERDAASPRPCRRRTPRRRPCRRSRSSPGRRSRRRGRRARPRSASPGRRGARARSTAASSGSTTSFSSAMPSILGASITGSTSTATVKSTSLPAAAARP